MPNLMYVHFETLVTPMYSDKSPTEVMERLDTMVNKYLTTTGTSIINCVEYGFKANEETDGLQAYARLCVYMPVEEDDNPEVNESECVEEDVDNNTESTEEDSIVGDESNDSELDNSDDNTFKSNISI